jgi:predicted DNA-binding protein
MEDSTQMEKPAKRRLLPITISTRLSGETRGRIENWAAKEDRPVSKMVRILIVEALNAREKKKNRRKK